MNKEDFLRQAAYYKEGDSVILGVKYDATEQGNLILPVMEGDCDVIFITLLEKYIEQQYSNFDGIQSDCIDFYRNKFNELFDKMEDEL